MNEEQIQQVFAFCAERGISCPRVYLLQQHRWCWIFAARWGNWSLLRWDLFGFISQFMTKDEYIRTLKYIWSHSEGALEALGVELSFRAHNSQALASIDFMSAAELTEFNSWPSTVTIYRGCIDETRDGPSWTVDINMARSFAQTQADEASESGILLCGTCNKSDILCYILNDMNEREVLVARANVTITREQTIY